MNRDQLKGRWKQLTGVATAAWGKLTGRKLKVVEGNAEHLAGKVQEAYGDARKAQKEIEGYVAELVRKEPWPPTPRLEGAGG